MSGIFISYRRSTSKHLARSIFMALQQRGHDVFLDVNSIDSGAFDGIIRNQIAARPHFLLILSTGALERCTNEGDWLRQEIEEAFRLNRNIVPIADEGFDIEREKHYLPEPIRTELPLINAPPYSHYYFDAFIQTLSDRFFKDKVDDLPVVPTPKAEQAEVQKRIEQAAQYNDGWIPQIEVTGTPQPISPQTQAELNAFMKRAAQAKVDNLPVIPMPQAEQATQPNNDSTIESPPTRFLPPAKPGDLGYVLRRSHSDQPTIWGVENILPPPFEWVYIPLGSVIIGNQSFLGDVFNVAKYPITNAQFEIFVQASDGYSNADWWSFSADARIWRKNNNTPLPRAFPEDDNPRANVNYYEALAFCNWLAAHFNAYAPNLPLTKITLPYEHQWLRAALGTEYREYPWGDEFDITRCNTEESMIRRTTPVTKYPSGASPYGVMDMIGNVWERCYGKNNRIEQDFKHMIGGSWNVKAPYVQDLLNSPGIMSTYAQTRDTGFRIIMTNS
ncbi:MAG: SUMF1/EgtB/PvdO family nonheme iron enzyme [Anaerolineaceae bacterium]|nr:SUMF1/EgtB/PvdO family nonheme iron enzyme [Anaerolineaceae bacterium]